MKAFISHAGPDKPVARRIAKGLTAAGIAVWLDEANIRVGESIPAEIGRGLEASDALVLLVSRAALASGWVDRELNSFVMHATGRGKAILPCLLDGSELPLLIGDLRYADFRDSFTQGLDALLAGVGIAEEMRRVARTSDAATAAGGQIAADDRLRCYNQFIARTGFKRNIFAISQEPREVFNVLLRHGLIVDEEDGHDGTFVATDLGTRVMSTWGSA